MPYPASARTCEVSAGGDQAIRVRRGAISSCWSEGRRYSAGTPARSSRASSPSSGLRQDTSRPTIAGTSTRASGSATPRFDNSQSCPRPTQYCSVTPTPDASFFADCMSSMWRGKAPPVRLRHNSTPAEPSSQTRPTRNGAAGRNQPRDPLGHRADALRPRSCERTVSAASPVAEPFHKRPPPQPQAGPANPPVPRASKSDAEYPWAWLTNSYSVKVVLGKYPQSRLDKSHSKQLEDTQLTPLCWEELN